MRIKYLWYVLRHKWFVFVECCRLGIPWRGIIHDLSKLSRAEFMAYARNFYSGKPKEETKGAFDVAWLHHQRRNRHHWQYWILQYDKSEKWDIRPHSDGRKDKYFLTEYMSSGQNYDVTCTPGVEHFLMADLNRVPVCLPMPDSYRKEMFADWTGAGKAILGDKADTKKWYLDHRENIMLHTETREWIERELGL